MGVKIYAIILAGGKGKRSKSKIPKQYLKFSGKTVLEHTLEKFNNNTQVDEIIIVLNKNDITKEFETSLKTNYLKIKDIVHIVGGPRRLGVYKGLERIKESNSKVLVHDAVRPFVSQETIDNCIDALKEYDAVYPAVASADTIIEVDETGDYVKDIPIRKYMLRGQTPQCFAVGVLKRAHLLAQNDPKVDEEVTNDCGLISRYQLCPIKVVPGNRENVKITYPEDITMVLKMYDEKFESEVS